MENKIIPFIIVAVLILSGFGVVALTDDTVNDFQLLQESLSISKPTIEEKGQYCILNLEEASSNFLSVGKPSLPSITRVFKLPFGSNVKQVDVYFSDITEITLSKEILPCPQPSFLISEIQVRDNPMNDPEVCSSPELYPVSSYSYSIGTGLDGKEHSTYLSIQLYPIRFTPDENKIYWCGNIDLNIIYEEPITPIVFPDEYDLVIIAPEKFASKLNPLVEHKNSFDMKTFLKTTEEIYDEYQGRDKQEQIKYFIKEMVEMQGISYIMLVGSIYEVPMRIGNFVLLNYEWDTFTDLYYADIYDQNLSFCSWDSNDNNRFGETGVDKVDLYPDVHIGRLACDSIDEVDIVVDKIINYETQTSGEEWFNKIILIGGDTNTPAHGGEAGWYEGEEHNKIIMDLMSDFEPIPIFTSLGNFDRRTISDTIDEGAGFLHFSGHGWEHGMGAYLPDQDKLKTYYTRYINDLDNEYKLPIMFFVACSNAKLDFVLEDIFKYSPYRILNILKYVPIIDIQKPLPCFAWSFVKHENGGAIASIGSTQLVVSDDNANGCERFSRIFFSAYDRDKTLGEIMTAAQNTYIPEIPNDFLAEITIEEFVLLGDPSLKIGGYDYL